MFKKGVSGIILTLVFLQMFVLTSSFTSVKAVDAEKTTSLLQMATLEDLTVLENGLGQLAIFINVTSAPLADAYRNMLAAPPDAAVEEEIQIPENKTDQIDLGVNTTTISIPVREEFHKSIAKEHYLSLGLLTNVSQSKIVPRGLGDECRVSLVAQTAFQMVDITRIETDELWQITVGPVNTTSYAEFVLAQIMFTKLMLESLPEEERYEHSHRITIKLPRNATLLNTDELAGQRWTIEFGGGTRLDSSITVDGMSTVIIDEKTVITEQNITANPVYIQEAFSTYRKIQIRYLLPEGSTSENLGMQKSGDICPIWHYDRRIELPPTSIFIPFRYDGLSLDLTVTPSLALSWYVGWRFRLLWLDSFEAWMSVEASIEIKIEASASVSLLKTWDTTIFRWATPFFFSIGPIPVRADLRFTVNAVLTVEAWGEVSFTVETEVHGEFKAGLRWDRGDWSPIKEKDLNCSPVNTTLNASAGISVTPSIEFQLAFLFYDVAGPFVEFEPYITATVTVLPERTWSVELGFKIDAGVTFSDWIKSLLGLEKKEFTLYNYTLDSWNGNWTEETPPPPPPPIIHDLSVISITPSVQLVFTGSAVDVNVTVRNNGEFDETFDVAVYQDWVIIGFHSNVNLTSGEHVVLTATWNTGRLRPGNYTLRAEATVVAGETNEEDNVREITVLLVQPNDIMIVDLECPSGTYVGRVVNITLTVRNCGDITEETSVTIYCNDTALTTWSAIRLASGEEETFVFYWDTSSFTPCMVYQMWANATTAHLDIDMANNLFDGGVIQLKMIGDINGDNIVDIFDVVLAVAAFGSKEGDLEWIADADLAPQYGIIDIYDFVTLTYYFGECG